MMQEVVAAKPQSAKAHYLYAEILAHDAKFSDAAAQARRAREIDPALSFTNDPEEVPQFSRPSCSASRPARPSIRSPRSA